MEWKEVTLGDLCEISSSKRIFAKEYQTNGIPFYRGKEIIEKQKGNTISNELFISRNRYEEIKAKYGVPQQRELLLTSVGTLGVPYVIKEEEFYFKDGNLTWFRHFNGLDVEYLYYWFLSPYGKNEINAKAIGSTQKALTIDSLSKFNIKIPINLEDQRRIASILSSLDRKIELNNKINADLEEMAQAIFKNWFVDFEPFKDGKFVDSELGMIPEGWKVGRLTEIASYMNGLAMQKFPPENNEDSLPVLKIKELGQGFCGTDSDRCSCNIKDECIIHNGDVIFSWSGTLLVDVWCGGDCGLNQHLFKVTSKDYPKWFYYYWTKHHLQEFIHIAKDKAVTMGHIKRGHLEEAMVAIPDNDSMEKAHELFEPILSKMISLRLENSHLSLLRDTLLPRLMSGELEVPE